MKKVLILVVAFLTVLTFVSFTNVSHSEAAYFTPLGDLPGGNFRSIAYDVSADGSVVVGHSLTASGNEAFRWTSGDGMIGLGDLAGGSFSSIARGVSDDGSVVVGYSNSASGQFEAFRWTSGGGMVGLGDLPGGYFESSAKGVSSDGSVVVGHSNSASGGEAFRWTLGGGMAGLGHLPGGAFRGVADGASADGSVIVGNGDSASGQVEAFRLTSGGGMVGLGDLPGGSFQSSALCVSADGSVVVGSSESASGREAFRWTSGGGMIGLGDLAGGSFYSNAFAVSGDGSVVVGRSNSASGSESFVWDSTNGMQSISSILINGGVDLTGWTLYTAYGISTDGQTIVGYGTNPSGNTEAWVANINLEHNIIISPSPYDFGNVNIGSTSTPQTFTISNTGDADLTLGTITLTGTDPTEFAIQNDYCSAQIISPAGDCTIDAVFVPTLDGAKSANLSIPPDDPYTPTLDVPLSGTGVINFDIVNIIQDWEVTGNVTITWESVSGLEYQIASKDVYTGTFSVVDTVTGSAESTTWTDDGTLTGVDPSAVQQRYYKVSQNSVDSGNIVGTYQIVVNEGMNLISLPFVPFSTALEDVIGVQVTGADNIGESDLIWAWDGTKYTFVWLVGGTGNSLDGKWYTGNNPTTVTLGADQGAWLQIRPGHGPVDLCFVGEVSNSNRAIPIVEGMNLIGTSFPYTTDLSITNLWESGFTGADNIGESDIIWSWVNDNYELIWLVDGVNNTLNGNWYIGNTPVVRNLEPGSGYWIQRRGGQLPFEWDYINQ